MEQPREKILENKIERDDNGNLLQGQLNNLFKNPNDEYNVLCTSYWYKDGKIHGKPGIDYFDGLQEEWDNGKFVKILSLPFKDR